MNKLTFRVSLGLCMQLYLVLHILKEHETLEANAWIALSFLAIVHLCCNPFDISIIILETGLDLRQLILHLQSRVVLPHLLA